MKKSFSEKLAEAQAEVASISPQEAIQRRQTNPEILFIDPRDENDIVSTTGKIPGALNITLDDLSSKPDNELPEDLGSHNRPIITACQGGPMGAIAAHELKKRGYNNVFFIDGGTQGWLDAGYSTAR